MFVHVHVCVCVCVCVCVWASERERESVCVCVYTLTCVYHVVMEHRAIKQHTDKTGKRERVCIKGHPHGCACAFRDAYIRVLWWCDICLMMMWQHGCACAFRDAYIRVLWWCDICLMMMWQHGCACGFRDAYIRVLWWCDICLMMMWQCGFRDTYIAFENGNLQEANRLPMCIEKKKTWARRSSTRSRNCMRMGRIVSLRNIAPACAGYRLGIGV